MAPEWGFTGMNVMPIVDLLRTRSQRFVLPYTHRRLKFGTGMPVKGRREYVHLGSMPAPCWQSLCRTPRHLLGHNRNLKCERYKYFVLLPKL